MTALAKDRNTTEKHLGAIVAYGVKASTKIYAGALVALDSTGYAIPATNAAGNRVVGRAEGQADNSAVAVDGNISVAVREGIFKWANDGTKPIVAKDVGRPCFVVDDNTVARETTKGIVAGIVTMIDPDLGIWVDTGIIDPAQLERGIETVTAGAISPYTRTTLLSVTGTQAYTLANGLVEGQRKTIICTVAASTPAGTLTPATFADGTSGLFNAVLDSLELEWHATGGWRIVAANSVTIS